MKQRPPARIMAATAALETPQIRRCRKRCPWAFRPAPAIPSWCPARSQPPPAPSPGAAACLPCALPAASRLGAASIPPTAFRGATAVAEFLAALVRAARFRRGLAPGVAFSGARGGACDALGRSVAANATVLSKPGGLVISTRTQPWNGPAAIQASYGGAERSAAATASAMRCRRTATLPLCFRLMP